MPGEHFAHCQHDIGDKLCALRCLELFLVYLLALTDARVYDYTCHLSMPLRRAYANSASAA